MQTTGRPSVRKLMFIYPYKWQIIEKTCSLYGYNLNGTKIFLELIETCDNLQTFFEEKNIKPYSWIQLSTYRPSFKKHATVNILASKENLTSPTINIDNNFLKLIIYTDNNITTIKYENENIVTKIYTINLENRTKYLNSLKTLIDPDIILDYNDILNFYKNHYPDRKITGEDMLSLWENLNLLRTCNCLRITLDELIYGIHDRLKTRGLAW